MTATAPAEFPVYLVSPALIDEDASQPRKIFTGIEELAASVAEHGVLQPLLVRPKDNARYLLVFGARRLRAVLKAKLELVPILVEEMTDAEALERQIVENGQRSDVHPLEEAEGYEALQKKHAYTVDKISTKTGKSKAYVYARMKLLALAPESRKAFYAGKIDASKALLVARIPGAKLQADALREIASDDLGSLSYRESQHVVQSRYMLELAEATFDTKSDTLTKAGPCTTCPKRTGNDPVLFADVKGKDVCTDPTCFGEKRDAAWTLKVSEAKEKGTKILTPKEVEKVFPHGGSHVAATSGFVDIDEEDWSRTGKNKTYRQLMGKHAPPPVLARDKRGDVHELVPAAALKKALKEAGVKVAPSAAAGSSETDKKVAKEKKAKAALMRIVQVAAIEAVVGWAEQTDADEAFARVLVDAISLTTGHASIEALEKRRGTPDIEVAKLKPHELRGMAVELLIGFGGVQSWDAKLGENLVAFAKLYGVDLKKIEAKAKSDLAVKAAEKKVGKK